MKKLMVRLMKLATLVSLLAAMTTCTQALGATRAFGECDLASGCSTPASIHFGLISVGLFVAVMISTKLLIMYEE
jgi:hypothetical protein